MSKVIDVEYEQPETVGAAVCETKHAWARVPVVSRAELIAAGDDLLSGSPLLVVSGGHAVRLDGRDGAVCAATFHGEVLILARMPSAPDAGLDDQSSPAYISSISLA